MGIGRPDSNTSRTARSRKLQRVLPRSRHRRSISFPQDGTWDRSLRPTRYGSLDRYGHLLPGNEEQAAGLLDDLPERAEWLKSRGRGFDSRRLRGFGASLR